MVDEIEITVNGDARRVPVGLSIAGLLAEFKTEPKMVVVELNGEIVARPDFGDANVEAGANVEIVQMMAGG